MTLGSWQRKEKLKINTLKGRKKAKEGKAPVEQSQTITRTQVFSSILSGTVCLLARVLDRGAFWQFITTLFNSNFWKVGCSHHLQFYTLNPPSLCSKKSKAILTHFSNTIFLLCDLLLQLLHGPKWAALSGCHSGMTFVKVTRFFVCLQKKKM